MDEVKRELKRPVVQKLRSLMRFRNECPAFEGLLQMEPTDDDRLVLRRTYGGVEARLLADCRTRRFTIQCRNKGEEWREVPL